MIKVNAIGDICPIPVVKTKNAIKEMGGTGTIEVLVDNEIAVQNLTKMANQKEYQIVSKKLEEHKYQVLITVGEGSLEEVTEEETYCIPDGRAKKTVVVIDSNLMGRGNDELGKVLMKGFIYALTQQDVLPSKILFYNGGATLTCEGSDSLEDLQSLEAQGVEIFTCGTCLNYYGMTDNLKVGSITNMYDICEAMVTADLIVKP